MEALLGRLEAIAARLEGLGVASATPVDPKEEEKRIDDIIKAWRQVEHGPVPIAD